MGIRKYLTLSDNKNTVYQKVWDTSKAVLRGKFIALNACQKWKNIKLKKTSMSTPSMPRNQGGKKIQREQKEGTQIQNQKLWKQKA